MSQPKTSIPHIQKYSFKHQSWRVCDTKQKRLSTLFWTADFAVVPASETCESNEMDLDQVPSLWRNIRVQCWMQRIQGTWSRSILMPCETALSSDWLKVGIMCSRFAHATPVIITKGFFSSLSLSSSSDILKIDYSFFFKFSDGRQNGRQGGRTWRHQNFEIQCNSM